MAVRNYILIGLAVIFFFAAFFPAMKSGYRLRRWRRGLCLALSSAMLLTVVLLPDLSSVKTTGPFAYDCTVIQLNDESRLETYTDDGSCRKLSVAVYYPKAESIPANSCPLVVYSHGGISIKTGNVSLFEELASHGYVVVSIDHTYQALYTTIDGRKIEIDSEYLKEINTEDSHEDIQNSYRCYQKWMNIRTGDINFVIDTFLSEAERPDNGFYSLIDASKIGLAGHSLGGSAALGVARQRSDIKAVLALESPYFCDITGTAEDAFTWDTKPYSCAILNIYSDSGYPLVETDNKYVQNKNLLSQSGTIENVYIEGSNHYSLTDLVRESPVLCELLGEGYRKSGYDTLLLINQKALAFFDRYL